MRSLNNQSYPRTLYEVIVIDNGSTDETVQIARQYADSVFVEKDIKVGAVRNRGATRAKGDILVFLDSDCVVDRNWIMRGMELLLEREQRVVGGALRSRENPSWIEKYWLLESEQSGSQQPDLMGSCIFIRKQHFNRLNGFDESITSGEDSDLSQRLRKAGFEILMSPAMAVIHLGSPTTVTDFVKRQVWHSENYALRFGESIKDKTFWLVVFYFLSILLVLLSFYTGNLLFITIPLSQMAPLALSLKRIKRAKYHALNIKAIAAIVALDNLYLIGRNIGLFKGILDLARR